MLHYMRGIRSSVKKTSRGLVFSGDRRFLRSTRNEVCTYASQKSRTNPSCLGSIQSEGFEAALRKRAGDSFLFNRAGACSRRPPRPLESLIRGSRGSPPRRAVGVPGRGKGVWGLTSLALPGEDEARRGKRSGRKKSSTVAAATRRFFRAPQAGMGG